MSYSNFPQYGQTSSRSQSSLHDRSYEVSGGYSDSEVEKSLVNSKQPLTNLSSNEQVTAGVYRGMYLNKHEAERWRGPIPLEQYPINNDPNPEKLKRKQEKVRYTQELGVRYLKPPQPPKPGDLIIRERNVSLPPAPPIVIRQQAERALTPPPQIFREVPPPMPPRIPEQVIEVDVPQSAPPRRVIVERLAAAPAPPPNLIVEKWLPYQPQKRRVRYERAPHQQAVNPRNLIITWEAPDVEVQTVCKDLGVVEADPEDYARRHGSTLVRSHELPTCTNGIGTTTTKTQHSTIAGLVASSTTTQTTTTTNCPIHFGSNSMMRAATQAMSSAQYEIPELEGDLEALKFVDIDKHGLSAYRTIVTSISGGHYGSSSMSSITISSSGGGATKL